MLIMHNLDHPIAVWVTNGAECSLTGDVTTDEPTDIIDSIYDGAWPVKKRETEPQ